MRLGIGILATILFANVALANPECEVHDKSFKSFLSRFTEDQVFQETRLVLPLVWRAGDYLTVDASVELWTLDKIKKLDYPLIYSSKQLKEERLVQSFPIMQPGRYAEVYQENAGEADSVRVLAHFRNIEGCWFLEEVDDRGL
ncbi:MAG: hypothetical protein ABI963_04310 [Rhizomicrobium sp.]